MPLTPRRIRGLGRSNNGRPYYLATLLGLDVELGDVHGRVDVSVRRVLTSDASERVLVRPPLRVSVGTGRATL